MYIIITLSSRQTNRPTSHHVVYLRIPYKVTNIYIPEKHIHTHTHTHTNSNTQTYTHTDIYTPSHTHIILHLRMCQYKDNRIRNVLAKKCKNVKKK